LAEADREPIPKKGNGKTIMVSEFLCECHGHMRITFQQAIDHNFAVRENGQVDDTKLTARVIITPGTYN
jgi:hypothetical protein